MAGLAANRFIVDPAKIEAQGGTPAPTLSLGQRGRWKWHDFMQRVDDVAVVGFSRNFPWVVRLSGGRDFHGFGKVRGTCAHALLKIGLLFGKSVFTLGEVLGQFGGIAIALESESDVCRAVFDHEDVGAKTRFDLGLIFLALRASLKRVAINEVIAGVQIVAPWKRGLGRKWAREKKNYDDGQMPATTGASNFRRKCFLLRGLTSVELTNLVFYGHSTGTSKSVTFGWPPAINRPTPYLDRRANPQAGR